MMFPIRKHVAVTHMQSLHVVGFQQIMVQAVLIVQHRVLIVSIISLAVPSA